MARAQHQSLNADQNLEVWLAKIKKIRLRFKVEIVSTVDKPSRLGAERGRLPNFKRYSLLKKVCPTVGMEGTPASCGDCFLWHVWVNIDFEAFRAD